MRWIVGWDAIAMYGVFGLLLAGTPQLFFRSRGPAGDARMTRGLQAFGTLFMHLAALTAFLKLAGAFKS